MKKYCKCCGTEITAEVVAQVGEEVKANPWNDDGVLYDFCSWECVDHEEEKHQEYLDSYEV